VAVLLPHPHRLRVLSTVFHICLFRSYLAVYLYLGEIEPSGVGNSNFFLSF
jgi:hypothetical protein